MTIVISLGGSTLSREDGELDIDFIRSFAGLIKKHASNGTRFVIVVGGGQTSRKYINAAGSFTDSNYIKDNIGIETTYLNAWLLYSAFNGGAEFFRGDPNSINRELKQNSVVVTGGIVPGISTDTVSMLLAESAGATHVINVSTPKGVYDESGKFVEEMGIDKLIELAMKGDTRVARSSFIFDVIACKIAKRSKTELHFLDKQINNIEAAIMREKHSGTVVKG